MNQLSSRQLIGTIIAVTLIITLGALAYGAVTNQDDSQPVNQTADTLERQPDEQQKSNESTERPTPLGPDGEVPLADIERIVLDRFGGSIDEIERETHRNIPAWEIEIKGSSEGDIEVKVDRQTGEILHWEHD